MFFQYQQLLIVLRLDNPTNQESFKSLTLKNFFSQLIRDHNRNIQVIINVINNLWRLVTNLDLYHP